MFAKEPKKIVKPMCDKFSSNQEYLAPPVLFSYQSLHNWLKFIMRQRLNLSKGYVHFCLKHTKVKSLDDPAMLSLGKDFLRYGQKGTQNTVLTVAMNYLAI